MFKTCSALILLAIIFSGPCIAGSEEHSLSSQINSDDPAAALSQASFGSRAVLESCWSKEELAGQANDKKIFYHMPYSGPPERTLPKHLGPPPSAERKGSIRSVIPFGNEKIVALTFDLCERANEKSGYDAPIFNYLRKNNVKATFFAGGKWMRSHPEKAMQLMADPLFELGNHSWTHENFRVIDRKLMEEQILWTQAQYELLREKLEKKPCAREAGAAEMAKIPELMSTFRFPFGTCNQEALDLLAGYGISAIQWSVVSGDPAKGQTAQGITRIVLQQIKPGSIIICHANGRGHGTAEALKIFIPKLLEKGYRFVTVSELLNSGRPLAAKECYEEKPGDNFRYDKLFGPPGHERK